MTNQNEFKEALNIIDAKSEYRWNDIGDFAKHHETIRRALLIADRLMQEPSNAMIQAAIGTIWSTHGGLIGGVAGDFKAMVNKMLEEIEGGK